MTYSDFLVCLGSSIRATFNAFRNSRLDINLNALVLGCPQKTRDDKVGDGVRGEHDHQPDDGIDDQSAGFSHLVIISAGGHPTESGVHDEREKYHTKKPECDLNRIRDDESD